MNSPIFDQTIFITSFRSYRGRECVHLLADSIRSFGGEMSQYPIWIFDAAPPDHLNTDFKNLNVQFFPLTVPASVKRYYFADKVYACAQAESLCSDEVHSLIWIDPACLVLQPPILFDLQTVYDAAVRPVHVRNIGLLEDDPVDGYWRSIYDAAGISDVRNTVSSFVDNQRLRAYFNSHAFALNPATGLFRRWYELFEIMVNDHEFQQNYCKDEARQIFLFQAIFSTLINAMIPAERLLILPQGYNYPFHLHRSVPREKRATSLNDLVLVAYEEQPVSPDDIKDIFVEDRYRFWLSERVKQWH